MTRERNGPTPGNLPEETKAVLAHHVLGEARTPTRPGEPGIGRTLPHPKEIQMPDEENAPMRGKPARGELTEGRPYPTKNIPAGDYETENDNLHNNKDKLPSADDRKNDEGVDDQNLPKDESKFG
jgi:hypothetical protein